METTQICSCTETLPKTKKPKETKGCCQKVAIFLQFPPKNKKNKDLSNYGDQGIVQPNSYYRGFLVVEAVCLYIVVELHKSTII